MSKETEVQEDILHFYFSDLIATFPHSARKNLYGSTFWEKGLNVIKYCFRSLKESVLKTPPPVEVLARKNWLYLIGDNNYYSLHFLQKELGSTVYVSPYRYKRKDATIHHLTHNSRFRFLFSNLLVFFTVLSRKKKAGIRCWDAVFRATGLFPYSIALLEKYRPRSITFSNDSTLEPRALLLAANTLEFRLFLSNTLVYELISHL